MASTRGATVFDFGAVFVSVNIKYKHACAGWLAGRLAGFAVPLRACFEKAID